MALAQIFGLIIALCMSQTFPLVRSVYLAPVVVDA